MTIPADLTGELGPVASATDWSTRFYSAPKLQVESRGCDAEPCGLEPITITLSTPITSKQLRKITLSPRPKEFARELVDEWDEGDGGREVQLLGRYLPGETYRVTIPAELRDVHGQRLGETVRYTARFGHVPTLGLSPHGGALKAACHARGALFPCGGRDR